MPVTIDGTTGITTPMYNGTIAANTVTPSVNMKNRIINGAMTVNQRVSTATAVPTGIYAVDRFFNYGNGGGVFTSAQSTDVPVGQGFVNSTVLTVTTPDSSIASSDYYAFGQYIEYNNTADFMFGTAAARTITLSFWVKSSVTGLYAAGIITSNGTRCYPATFTISAANTWQFVTLTVPGDTGGTWNNTFFTIRFDLGSGSANNGTANTWNTAGGFVGSRTSSTVNWIATNGATLYMTGVQVEVGSTATSFDYRPFGTELQLCQRYFQKSYNLATAPGTSTFVGIEWMTLGNYSGRMAFTTRFATPMRTSAAVVPYDSTGTANRVRTSSGDGQTGYVVRGPSENNFSIDYTGGNVSELLYQWTADADIY